MRVLLFFLVIYISTQTVQAQESDKNHNKYHNNTSFIENTSLNKEHKFTPFRWVMGSFMFVYQNVISDHYLSQCAYYPSCSNFSKYAIKEFGWVKGVFLTADRIQRCNTLSLSQEPNEMRISIYSFYDPPIRYKKDD